MQDTLQYMRRRRTCPTSGDELLWRGLQEDGLQHRSAWEKELTASTEVSEKGASAMLIVSMGDVPEKEY